MKALEELILNSKLWETYDQIKLKNLGLNPFVLAKIAYTEGCLHAQHLVHVGRSVITHAPS